MSGDRLAGVLDTYTRSVDLPVSSPSKVHQALAFQVESLSHVPLEELVYAPQLTRTEKGTQALVFLARKEALRTHLAEWKALGLEPDFITASSKALVAFARFRCPELSSGFLVHLGMEEWTCVWMEEGQVKKTFAIERTAEMRSLLRNALLALEPSAKKKSILFTGHADQLGGFLLEGTASLSLYEPTPPLKQEESKGALAIGAALEALDGENPVQFLRGEFIPTKTWEKAGKRAALLIATAIVLSGCIGIFGYAQLRGAAPALAGEARPALKQHESLYLLQAPTATEVLAWLSTHPLLEALAIAGDPLQIQDLRYELSSLPKIGEMDAPYTAKIAIAFHVQQPISARKFHDALLHDERMVDVAQEIAWEPLNEGYKVSFHLKNRTPYVF